MPWMGSPLKIWNSSDMRPARELGRAPGAPEPLEAARGAVWDMGRDVLDGTKPGWDSGLTQTFLLTGGAGGKAAPLGGGATLVDETHLLGFVLGTPAIGSQNAPRDAAVGYALAARAVPCAARSILDCFPYGYRLVFVFCKLVTQWQDRLKCGFSCKL